LKIYDLTLKTQANKRIVNARNVRGGLKNPKLAETCAFYGIDFDEEQYRSVIYNVTKTPEILNRMVSATRVCR